MIRTTRYIAVPKLSKLASRIFLNLCPSPKQALVLMIVNQGGRGVEIEREKLPVAIFCEPHHLNHMIPGTEDINNKILVLTVARCHFSNQQNGF